MPKMEESVLLGILAAEKADALSADQAAKLTEDRERAMSYYNGDVSEDMPSQPDRSKAVSSDVADTVDGLMPSLMEIFCGGDEVVKFSPVGPEDEEAAQQETDYINHVMMQENDGFLVIYSFAKDALLSKNGIVKVHWEETEEERPLTRAELYAARPTRWRSTIGVRIPPGHRPGLPPRRRSPRRR